MLEDSWIIRTGSAGYVEYLRPWRINFEMGAEGIIVTAQIESVKCLSDGSSVDNHVGCVEFSVESILEVEIWMTLLQEKAIQKYGIKEVSNGDTLNQD